MGHYTDFKFKVTLKKETPQVIISFLINQLYNHDFFETYCPDEYKEEYKKLMLSEDDLKKIVPVHPLFKLQRWDSIFNWHYLYDRPLFYQKNGYWILLLQGSINYGFKEINEFADFISPFVAGHKKKKFLGSYRGETDEREYNLYREL